MDRGARQFSTAQHAAIGQLEHKGAAFDCQGFRRRHEASAVKNTAVAASTQSLKFMSELDVTMIRPRQATRRVSQPVGRMRREDDFSERLIVSPFGSVTATGRPADETLSAGPFSTGPWSTGPLSTGP